MTAHFSKTEHTYKNFWECVISPNDFRKGNVPNFGDRLSDSEFSGLVVESDKNKLVVAAQVGIPCVGREYEVKGPHQ